MSRGYDWAAGEFLRGTTYDKFESEASVWTWSDRSDEARWYDVGVWNAYHDWVKKVGPLPEF